MRTGWVSEIPNVQGGSPFVVRKNPQGADFGLVELASPPKGVGHTTEGNAEVPSYGNNAPQFTIGKLGLHQHRAFGRMAGTLRNEAGGTDTNSLIRIQFELVEFSELVPWLPESNRQCDMLASVFEFAQKDLDIPERHVWPDEQEPGTIAVPSYTRRQSRFPHRAGWYTHAEIPENSHWDMGDCLITKLMRREPVPDLVTAHGVYISYRMKHGGQWHRHSQRITPFFSGKRGATSFALSNRKRALTLAMLGKVDSEAHGSKVIEVRNARPYVVTKRVQPRFVRD